MPAKSIPDDLKGIGEVPPLPTFDISQEIVEKRAKTTGGGAVPRGVGTSQLKLWLKTYGGNNKEFHK